MGEERHFIGSGSVLMVLGPVSAPIFWYVNGVSHSGSYFDLSLEQEVKQKTSHRNNLPNLRE